MNIRPSIEVLERRDTPSRAFVASGNLLVYGDDLDTINAPPVNDTISVSVVGSDYVVDVNGTGYTIPQVGVSRIQVAGGSGDDNISISSDVTVRAQLYGQDGNDTLSGGGGNDKVYGGFGDDVLLGNAGDDFLDGHLGFDIFDGGAGFDTAYDTEAVQLAMAQAVENTHIYGW